MSRLVFQIDTLPDLSLNKYQSLSNSGVSGVLKRHTSMLRQWHGICTQCGVSFHLLYTYSPSELIGQRLGLYVVFQGEESALKMLAPLVLKSPLDEFYTLKESVLPGLRFKSGATFTKKERVANIFNPLTGQRMSAFYVPQWKIDANARLYDLFCMMETVSQSYDNVTPCAYRIDVYPTTDVQTTRDAFEPILKNLRGDNDIKLLRETDGVRSDNYARDVCKEYENWIESIETTPFFRANIYAFSDSLFQSKVLLTSAGAEALVEGDYAIAQIKPDSTGEFSVTSRMGNTAEDYCFFPNQSCLKSWSTTYTLEELQPLFRFPALFEGETIELPKETAPIQVKDGLYFGKDTNNYPVNFTLKNLPRHAFFTGMPGCGKTNTMLLMATQLHDAGIPFLVLEPAKKEYRELLGYERMRDIHLFSPHLMSHFPLKLNPLEFPKGVRLSEHISALLEVFQGTFLLEGPTYKFLSNSIQRSYTNLGWNIEEVNDDTIHRKYPTLQDVFDNLQAEINASTYDSELKGNVQGFLQVRLGGLMERDAGDLFNVSNSTVHPEDWLKIAAIVELEVLPEQAKNFFVLLVCHYILETLRAHPAGGIDSAGNKLPVRHVVFIEEAHNIIAPTAQQSGSDSVDPKISATAYIVKMLAEVRALREAIIIADQLPTALASEVTKNTGLKVVHRLTAQDDREQIGSAISASGVQLERMAAFTIGRAFIYHEKTQKPFEVQIAVWEKPEISFDYTKDAELYRQLFHTGAMQDSIAYAIDNWYQQSYLPVQDKITVLNNRYQKTSALDTSKLLDIHLEKTKLSEELVLLEEKVKRMRQLWFFEASDCGSLSKSLTAIERNLRILAQMLEKMEVICV